VSAEKLQMNGDKYCVICRCAGVTLQDTPRISHLVRCNRCGTFEISSILAKIFEANREDQRRVQLRPYLSAHLRQSTQRGELVALRAENWEDLAEGHQHTTAPQRLDLLLKLFAERSPTLGTVQAASRTTSAEVRCGT